MAHELERARSVVTELQTLNTRRLKYVGIATYFGVYALIALGARHGVNWAFRSLPGVVRPAPLAPLDVSLGLPTSVAWGITSLSVALLTVSLVALHSLFVARSAVRSNDTDRTPTDD